MPETDGFNLPSTSVIVNIVYLVGFLVILVIQGYSRLFKVIQGYSRLLKVV
ncbi:hypothetical protein PROVRETT_09779 [Providencia rettgeri DSM 1131]|nr:hypothetical protein PROVRETT_09779 [Providencia rettgeri DSM 1131]